MFYVLLFSIAVFLFIIVVTIFQRFSNNKPIQDSDAKNNIISLTDETFEETIKTGVTLVDFWAPWCRPCRSQMPVVNQIADEKSNVAKICKINVDDHKKAAIKMKIKNIPNIIIFKEGVAVRQLIGSKPKHLILKALNDTLYR